MNKSNIILFGLITFTLFSLMLISADEQTYFPCGGDSETIFLCFGDIENSPIGSQEVLIQEEAHGHLPEKSNLIYYLIVIFISCFIVIFCTLFMIYKKRKKKQN